MFWKTATNRKLTLLGIIRALLPSNIFIDFFVGKLNEPCRAPALCVGPRRSGSGPVSGPGALCGAPVLCVGPRRCAVLNLKGLHSDTISELQCQIALILCWEARRFVSEVVGGQNTSSSQISEAPVLRGRGKNSGKGDCGVMGHGMLRVWFVLYLLNTVSYLLFDLVAFPVSIFTSLGLVFFLLSP